MNKELNEKIDTVNDDLYDNAFILLLESRLETDPLLANGLINLIDGFKMNHTPCAWCDYCDTSNTCVGNG